MQMVILKWLNLDGQIWMVILKWLNEKGCLKIVEFG